MDVLEFKKLPILGILRLRADGPIEDIVEATVSSGLKAIEITMNSENAAGLIARAARASKARLMIGAGTVLTTDLLKESLDAGATFTVLPTLVEDVVRYCVKNVIPVFPGAFSPQEVLNAWNSGATMVKVFPSSLLGPGYIRELKGPFDKIELMACGGITSENIKAYFKSGASAVAFGAGVFKSEWIDRRDFASITGSIRDLIDHAR